MEMKIEERKKELLELREELVKMEYRLRKLEMGISRYSADEIKNELKKEYPNIKFDDDLIELVGTLPYFPAEKDKEMIREAVERLIK